jgi:DNA adenine methylase
MKYMGSKARIANEILPIILRNRKNGQYYVEPFVGGCNCIDKVDGSRIAGDVNKYLITMWQGLIGNRERPYRINKNLYDMARNAYRGKPGNYNFEDFLIGWIGWMASFNGRFFDGGYSGKAAGRNYIEEQIKNTEKQIPLIKDVKFYSCDYSKLPFPANCIIYCDIPYKDTKRYDVSKHFDYNKFWNWCRIMASFGHEVFISEYHAPDDFECVWSKKLTNSMNTTKTYKPTEKLFTIKNNS